MAKEISLDDLATLVKQRFDDLEDQNQTNFDQVNHRIDLIEKNVSTTRSLASEHNLQIDRVERKLDATIRLTDHQSLQLKDHGRAIRKLEDRVLKK